MPHFNYVVKGFKTREYFIESEHKNKQDQVLEMYWNEFKAVADYIDEIPTFLYEKHYSEKDRLHSLIVMDEPALRYKNIDVFKLFPAHTEMKPIIGRDGYYYLRTQGLMWHEYKGRAFKAHVGKQRCKDIYFYQTISTEDILPQQVFDSLKCLAENKIMKKECVKLLDRHYLAVASVEMKRRSAKTVKECLTKAGVKK